MFLNKDLNSVEKISENVFNSSIYKLIPLPCRFKYLIAFTLAEVLITLLIIGVVASIVIPALINDTQDSELKIAWKKTYSDISQATQRIKMDLGGVISFSNVYEMKNEYLGYLSYIKSCDRANWGGNCWHKPGTIKYINGDFFTAANMDSEFADNPAAILNNGALVIFVRWDCSSSGFCGHIDIDVNGFKAPNTVGKDIFRIWILKNLIVPQGSPNSRHPGICPSSGGWACSTNYLYQ